VQLAQFFAAHIEMKARDIRGNDARKHLRQVQRDTPDTASEPQPSESGG